VGFVDHPKIEFCGASPDGLVDDGLVEIKCPNTTTHIGWVLAGVVPEEHKPQMILQCACTGRPLLISFRTTLGCQRHRGLCEALYAYSRGDSWIEKEITDFLAEVDQMFDQLTKVEML
jgi:hypothetical protein